MLADADDPYPFRLACGTPHKGMVHLSALPRPRGFVVGARTYASAFDPPQTPESWAARLAPYLFDFSAETLTVGRYCQIADGVRFVTSSANHAMDGLTTYPFAIFDPELRAGYQPDSRDTRIGNDVWLGQNAMILPGARIGDGAIIGAGAVVRGAVPDYAIVAGNPAQVMRMRMPPGDIDRMLALAWWDWPDDAIARARTALTAGDLDGLDRLAP